MTQTISNSRSLLTPMLGCLCGMALIIIFLASNVNAQSSATDGRTPPGLAPGAPAGSYGLSGFENVNLFNGNLNLSLPLLQIGGRGGARSGMNLTLDSTHWTVERTEGSSEDPEVYNLYNPGTHPPIIGGGGSGTPASFDVSPELWEGLRVGYGPGVLQGRFARWGRTGSSPTLTRLTFTAPDGTEYELRDVLTNGKPLTGNPRNRGTVFVSAGGSSITFVSNQAITDVYSGHGLTAPLSGYLMMADGTRYQISEGLVTSIRDRNGNQLTYSYYGNVNSPWSERRVHTVTDSVGRTVTVVYAGTAPANAPYDQISFNGFGGVQRTIKIWRGNLGSALRTDRAGDYPSPRTYGQLFPSIYASGFGGGISVHNPSDVATAVELPDGRKYWLYYNVYGELARLVLPTGGVIEYDYTPPDGVVSSSSGYQIHRRVTERRVYREGQTLENRQTFTPTYTPTYNGSNIASWATDVVIEQHDMLLGAGNTLTSKSKHSFYGSPVPSMYQSPVSYPEWKEGRQRQVETYDASGNLLRLVTNTWQQCTDCELSVAWWTTPPQNGHTAENAPPNNPNVVETVTMLKDVTPNLVTKQRFAYDKYNNGTRIEEYGYGQSADTAPLLRYTENSYVATSVYSGLPVHLRNLPTRVSIFDSTNVERARTTYEYDNYIPDAGNLHAALFPRSDIIGVDATFTSEKRGNATGTSSWLLSSSGAEVRAIISYQQFDVAGQMVSSIDPLGNRTTYDFADNFGAPGDNEARTNTPPAPLGSLKTYAVVRKVTNALSQSAYTQYDYWTGFAVNREDANGVISSHFHDDELNRLTKLIQAAGTSHQNQISVSYDDQNRVIEATGDLNAYGDNLLKSQTLYDGLGRTTETRSYEDQTTWITTKQEYDGFGRVQRSSTPYRTTDDPTYGWTQTTYDALGRLIRVTLPDGTSVTTTYSGNTVTVRDQANKQRRSTADALGRMTRVEEMNEYPSANVLATTTYAHDATDSLMLVTQEGQYRSFVYDSLKRLVSSSLPETGIISYTYDDNNNVREKVDPRVGYDQTTHFKTTYAYDAINRLVSRIYNDGTAAVNYYYDSQQLPAGGPALERGASMGRPLAVTYGGGNAGTYYGYDSLGRIAQSAQVTEGHAYLMGYTHNLRGLMTRRTYPSGREVTIAHDSVGRLSNLSGQQSGEADRQYLSQVTYAPHGNVNALRLGNGLWERRSFNSRMQPTELKLGTQSNQESVLKLNYAYGTTNNNGNIQTQKITMPGLNPLTQTYSYDAVNRLLVANETGGANQWQQYYGYDRFGNRRLIPEGTNLPAILDNINNPTISQTNNRLDGFSYDAAGNLTVDPMGRTFTYDAENRLMRYNGGAPAGGADYAYDGIGRRIKQVTAAGTTLFVYNAAGQLVAEYTNTMAQANGTRYLTTDTLGTPRVITSANGGVQSRHDYLPFGEEITQGFGGRSPNQGYLADNIRQKFTGKERDNESGLDYFIARHYSSTVGRFVSPDSFTGFQQNPQTLNLYAYVQNNPLKYVDPDGHMAEPTTPNLWDLTGPENGGPTITTEETPLDGEQGPYVDENNVLRNPDGSLYGLPPEHVDGVYKGNNYELYLREEREKVESYLFWQQVNTKGSRTTTIGIGIFNVGIVVNNNTAQVHPQFGVGASWPLASIQQNVSVKPTEPGIYAQASICSFVTLVFCGNLSVGSDGFDFQLGAGTPNIGAGIVIVGPPLQGTTDFDRQHNHVDYGSGCWGGGHCW
jgi:RHS repeat-associated protein